MSLTIFLSIEPPHICQSPVTVCEASSTVSTGSADSSGGAASSGSTVSSTAVTSTASTSLVTSPSLSGDGPPAVLFSAGAQPMKTDKVTTKANVQRDVFPSRMVFSPLKRRCYRSSYSQDCKHKCLGFPRCSHVDPSLRWTTLRVRLHLAPKLYPEPKPPHPFRSL